LLGVGFAKCLLSLDYRPKRSHAALGVFTAEGGMFTAGHGMNDDNRLKTAAMLSELWDGKPIKRVRALDGVTILPGRRLALHVMIQPDAAAGFYATRHCGIKDCSPASLWPRLPASRVAGRTKSHRHKWRRL
jgi:hypothetical protein